MQEIKAMAVLLLDPQNEHFICINWDQLVDQSFVCKPESLFEGGTEAKVQGHSQAQDDCRQGDEAAEGLSHLIWWTDGVYKQVCVNCSLERYSSAQLHHIRRRRVPYKERAGPLPAAPWCAEHSGGVQAFLSKDQPHSKEQVDRNSD